MEVGCDDVVDCGDDGGVMGVTVGKFTVCEQPAVIEETGPRRRDRPNPRSSLRN